MSKVDKLLTAACKGGFVEFNKIDPALLTQDERMHYDFVRKYYDKFGKMPGEEATQDANYTWVDGEEGFDYYHNHLLNRTRVNIASKSINNILNLIQNNQGAKIYDAVSDVYKELSELEAQIFAHDGASFYTDAVNRLLRRRFEVGSKEVITTGYPTLDEAHGGFRRGELYTIPGRPKAGKTHILGYMAHSAWDTGANVAFLSLEMTQTEMSELIIAHDFGVSTSTLKKNILPTPFLKKLAERACNFEDHKRFRLQSLPLGTKISDILPFLLRDTPDVVYIDSVYRMAPERQARDRFQAVSYLVEELKALAIRLDRPVVVTTQFGRIQKNGNSKGKVSEDNVAESDKYLQESALILGIDQVEHPTQPYRILRPMAGRYGGHVNPFKIKFEPGIPVPEDNYQFIEEIDDLPEVTVERGEVRTRSTNMFMNAKGKSI